MAGRTVTILSSNALVNEVCDETRFKKTIGSVLKVNPAHAPRALGMIES